MKITYSNKTLTAKPQGMGIGKYFGSKGSANRIQFKTAERSIEDFQDIVSSGHTLAYQCVEDDVMNRKANYIGTDFIIIDIDSTDLTIDEVVERTTYKPTIIHTTFSNLTERKGNKYCYHLIYCMTETLYGEQNFDSAFAHFCCGIEDLVDSKAKDCHRITFTSNSTLPNYEYRLIGNTYSATTIGDAPNDYSSTIGCLSNSKEDSSVKKRDSSSIYYSLYNMNEEDRSLTVSSEEFELDQVFLTDLTTLPRKDFIYKYSSTYEYITYTPPTVTSETLEGIVYADYRGIDYYELPSLWRTNDFGDRERQKVEIGDRTTQLYVEANIFILIKPDISKEHLVYDLVRDVYENYNNSDGQFTNHYILSMTENVWLHRNEFIGHPIPRKFKILKSPIGMTKQSCVGIVRRLLKDESIGSLVDMSLSIEENLIELRKLGVKVKKNRLLKFIKDNHLDDYIKSDRQIKDECVMRIVSNHPDASLRELADICKQQNIMVSYETIRKVKKKIV